MNWKGLLIGVLVLCAIGLGVSLKGYYETQHILQTFDFEMWEYHRDNIYESRDYCYDVEECTWSESFNPGGRGNMLCNDIIDDCITYHDDYYQNCSNGRICTYFKNQEQEG